MNIQNKQYLNYFYTNTETWNTAFLLISQSFAFCWGSWLLEIFADFFRILGKKPGEENTGTIQVTLAEVREESAEYTLKEGADWLRPWFYLNALFERKDI